MVLKGYICEKCGEAGTDKKVITIHEKVPVTGVILQRSGIYGIKDKRYRGDFVFISEERPLKADHKRSYSAVAYHILQDPFSVLMDTNLQLRSPFVKLEDVLCELEWPEFHKMRDAFTTKAHHEYPYSEKLGNNYAEFETYQLWAQENKLPPFKLTKGTIQFS